MCLAETLCFSVRYSLKLFRWGDNQEGLSIQNWGSETKQNGFCRFIPSTQDKIHTRNRSSEEE